MRRVLFVITRAFVILLILNILTNNYFSYNFINIFVLSMLSLPGIIVIYFGAFLGNVIFNSPLS